MIFAVLDRRPAFYQPVYSPPHDFPRHILNFFY